MCADSNEEIRLDAEPALGDAPGEAPSQTEAGDEGAGPQQLRMEVHAKLMMLRKAILNVSPEDPEIRTIDGMLEDLRVHAYEVAVVGEFNRGKSSLINALLGMSILPADMTPTTATVNRVVYGDHPQVTLNMRDGTREPIPFTALKSRVTKLSEEAESAASRVEEAVIAYPTVFCRNNVSILDTPGLNESAEMDALSITAARNADAVIFLIHARIPFSQSEARALLRLLSGSSIRHVLFTVTFIDLFENPDDVERVINAIRKRIGKLMFPLIEKDAGLSDEEKPRLKDIIAEAPVLGVSAKKALDAFVSGSKEELQDSRIESYKVELMTRLTAQQNEALTRDMVPYVRQMADAYQKAVARRVAELRTPIEEGKTLIAQANDSLSALEGNRQACIQRWKDSLTECAGTKDEIQRQLAEVVEAHIAGYSNPGAVVSAGGWKSKLKEKTGYRGKDDPATRQLEAAYALVQEHLCKLCAALDEAAGTLMEAALEEMRGDWQKIFDKLNRASDLMDLSEARRESASPEGMGQDTVLFGGEGIQALCKKPLPALPVGSFESARQNLSKFPADWFYDLFTKRMNALGGAFPTLDEFKSQCERAIQRLEARAAELEGQLKEFQDDAEAIGKMI